MIEPRDIDVVVQGPVIGTPLDPLIERHTQLCLESIKRYLPDAHVILSTWKGSDLHNLTGYDELVETEDPGTYSMGDFSGNAVRQVVSSREGLRHATRTYALKIRSDVILKGTGFLRYYSIYNALPFDSEARILHQRVALLTTCNPRRRSKFPYNPSDWFYFGLRDDLCSIFESPMTPEGESFPGRDPLTGAPRLSTSPYSPEQYIWFSFLARHRTFSFQGMDDVSHYNIEHSERYFANNAILLTARMASIDWLKYPGAAYAQIPCLSNSGLYTWNDYKRMLNTYAGCTLRIIPNPFEELLYATVYPFRFWLRSKNQWLYQRIVRLVNGENHRRVERNQGRIHKKP
jgi:hypothetical protein